MIGRIILVITVAVLSGCLTRSAQAQPKCGARITDGKEHTFSGFWNPKPWEPLTISIIFDSNNVLGCADAPLEITVPNNQKVSIQPVNWDKSCKPTLSVANAPTDSSISDVMGLLTKLGGGGHLALLQPTPYELPPISNKVATFTVECAPKDGIKQTQTVKITYQNPPRMSVSTGILISSGVKSYGIKTTTTGVNSSGVTTTQSAVAVTGNPTVQVVPFGMANIYLMGSRKMNLSSQLGVGVNPNLSSAKIEFFVAPIAFSWKDIYFSPGLHIGQHEVLAGGFKVGDVVSGLSKPPVSWAYRPAFAFSISYSLKPLAKSVSSK
jgi:hypothetical protein